MIDQLQTMSHHLMSLPCLIRSTGVLAVEAAAATGEGAADEAIATVAGRAAAKSVTGTDAKATTGRGTEGETETRTEKGARIKTSQTKRGK